VPNELEKHRDKLKQEYPVGYHREIEQNFERVSRQMAALRGSVSISEGKISMEDGLPLRGQIRRTRRVKGRKGPNSKRSIK